MIDVKTTLKWNGDEAKIQGKKVVNKSLFETGFIIEGQAKELINPITGRLGGSITTQSRTEGTKPDGNAQAGDIINKPSEDMVVHVGTAVKYGPYVEFGTVRNKAYPYLRPALALAQGKVLNLFRKNGKVFFADFMKK